MKLWVALTTHNFKWVTLLSSKLGGYRVNPRSTHILSLYFCYEVSLIIERILRRDIELLKA